MLKYVLETTHGTVNAFTKYKYHLDFCSCIKNFIYLITKKNSALWETIYKLYAAATDTDRINRKRDITTKNIRDISAEHRWAT